MQKKEEMRKRWRKKVRQIKNRVRMQRKTNVSTIATNVSEQTIKLSN